MNAIYVSVWDGGVEVRTSCQYNPKTRIVSDIESSDVEGLDNLEREYIELPDGTEIEVMDFDTFRDTWESQECQCDGDTNYLKQTIAETDDYEEIFEVIATWSQKPKDERIAAFLERNNSTIVPEN